MRATRPVLAVVVVGVVATCVAAAVSHPSGRKSGSGSAPAAAPWAAQAGPAATPSANPPNPEHHDTSPPLRTIPPAPPTPPENRSRPEHEVPGPKSGTEPDPVVQTSRPRLAAPALAQNFLGLGTGFSGPQGSMSPDSAPPDTNGAVGLSNYVEVVNESFAVFSKTGTVLYGPVPTNTLWSGFGGGCQTNNDGDATVAYDRIANRWILQQFSVSTTPYLECVAVSTSSDPTGTWYRYSYQYANFPDYPKLGVWPDAYYVALNLFNGSTDAYMGPEVCAYNRAKMLAGQAATQQCFTMGTSYGAVLPADFDGSRLPPTGEPNTIAEIGTGALHLWRFHVDWTTPANSTLTGPQTLSVASFSPLCPSSSCVAQSGTSQKLDGLGDRLMYRLPYRNFGDHEALLVSHAVSTGMRWYELRNINTTPTIYQQGTYGPDSSTRWMGSVAMDQSGGIALGYSVSSSSLHPSIRYTGRLAGDALGQMTQGEGTLMNGPGSQTGSNLDRWGDYSSMQIDPSDDCTFWYTNEYLPSSGAFNWATRIGSFKLPNCGGSQPPPANDFSISAQPSTLSVVAGQSGQTTISTALTSGSAQTVQLSASGQPAGSVTFQPTSVSAGGSSTMTVNVDAAATAGQYTVTVTGTGASATHTTAVTLTVTSSGGGGGGGGGTLTNGDFETGTLAGWTAGGDFAPKVATLRRSGRYAAQLGSTGPVDGDSTLSQTVVVPSGSPKLTFYYLPRCDDSLRYDQIQMQIRSTSGRTLATVLNVCSYTSSWKQMSYSMRAFAGQTVVLWFNDHDDGYAGDPTYFLLDDVTLG